MPTYDYICKACKHEFEQFQSMSAPTLRKCPACAKNKLERKIGVGAGIIFKGGGFYETDYRSESYKKGAEADTKAASSKTDDSKTTKTDSGSAASGTKQASDSAPAKSAPAPDSKPAPSKNRSGRRTSSKG